MNDKEFNRSILAELYKIADKVFEEGVNVPEEGSYTASKLVRIGKKESIFKNGYITAKRIAKSYQCGYETVYEEHSTSYSVKVGNFEASFCASKIFELVAKFEKLAGFGKAKQRVFTYSGKDRLGEIGSVTVFHEAKETTTVDECSVNEHETPCNPVSVPQNELSERKEIAHEGNTETARLAKGNSKRFTLYAIGLNNGDELQFVDGQIVTVCSEKKVAYEGREYTLSGFTKAFVLKKNKSGAYRGIMYFYKDGVRLDKYAEAYFASGESGKDTEPVLPKEDNTSTCVTTPTETPPTKEASVVVATPCNEGVVTSKTVGRVGFCMSVGRFPEPNMIWVAVLLNIFSVPRTERNHLPVRRLPEILRVCGGCGSRTRAICFTRIIPHKRRTTPVHTLCNPPPCVWPAREKKRAIRRLCELFKTPKNKFIDMENVINIPSWDIAEQIGYKPITTFWQDFSIADKYGLYEIIDTFNRAFDEWKSDYKYLTELVLVLNHKTWQHYVPGGDKTQNRIASLYNALWAKASEYALDNLCGSELEYYLNVAD